MGLRNLFGIGWRVVVLTFLLALLFIMTAMLFRVGDAVSAASNPVAVAPAESAPRELTAQKSAAVQSEQAGAALWLLLAAFLQTTVWSFVITRSRWRGWRLCAVVFVVFFGLTAVLSQIEMVVFVPRAFATGIGLKMVLVNLATSAGFAVMAVLLFGQWRKLEGEGTPTAPVRFSPASWVWRLAAAAVVYVILYLSFGYLLIWQNPTAREFYTGAGVGSPSGESSLTNTMTRFPVLATLQIGRALVFVALAIPILRMTEGGRFTGALGVALLFGVVFPAQLLVPNPWMPDIVRHLHFVETGVSTFIFGWVVGILFGGPRRRASPSTSMAPPDRAI